MMSVVATAHALERMLAARFPAPEYAFLPQVRNSTGFSSRVRTADAIVMGLWPSRGVELHGFELKVRRNDWVKELKQPAKAEEICRFCDRWWVVVGDRSIVKDGELPPTWGLVAPHGDKLKVFVNAPKLDSQPISREFLAAILRRAWETIEGPNEKLLQAERRRGYDEGIEYAKKSGVAQEPFHQRQYNELKATVDAFERDAGVKITGWDRGSIADAVKVLMHGGLEKYQTAFLRMSKQARQVADEIDAAFASGSGTV